MSLTVGPIDGKVTIGTKTFDGVKDPVERALDLIAKDTGTTKTYPQAAVLAGYLEDGSITMEQLAALCTEDTPEKNAERINIYLGMLAEIKGGKTVPKENIKFLFDVLLKIKEGNNKQKIDAVKFILEKISVDITKSDACGSFDAANFANTIDLQILLQGSTLGASFNNNIIDLNTFILSEFKAGDSVTKDILLKAKQLFDWMGAQKPPIGVEADRGKIAVWLAFKFKDAELAVIQAAVTRAGLSKDTTLANVKGASFGEPVKGTVTPAEVQAELEKQGVLKGDTASQTKLTELLLKTYKGKSDEIVSAYIADVKKLYSLLPAEKRGAETDFLAKVSKYLIAEDQGSTSDKDIGAINELIRGDMRLFTIIGDGTPTPIIGIEQIKLYVTVKPIYAELNKAPKIGQDDTTRNVIAIALAKKYPDKQAAEIITELKRVITERVKVGPPPVTEEVKIAEGVKAQLAALQSSDLTGIMADMFPASKVDTAPEVVGDGKVHTSDVVPDITQEQVNESFAVNFLGLTPKEYAELTDKSWKGILAKLYDKMVKGGYLKAGDKITWEAFNAYISDSKSSVLLVNRMNQTAFKEFFGSYMEENDDVPGMLRMMHRVNYTTLKKANAMDLLKAYLVDAQGYVSYDSERMAQGISREIGKTQCPSGLDTAKFEQFKKFISGDSSVKDFSLADFMEVLTKLGAKKEQIEPILTTIAQFDADKSTISYEEFRMLLTKIASDLKLKPDDAGIIGKREADVIALYKFLTGEKTAPKADEQPSPEGDTVTDAEYDDFNKIKTKYESLQDPIAQANYLLEVMEKTTKDDIRNNVAVSIYAGYVEFYLASGRLPQGIDSDKATEILTKFEALLKSEGISSLTMEQADPSDPSKTVKVEVKIADILSKIVQAKEKLAEMKRIGQEMKAFKPREDFIGIIGKPNVTVKEYYDAVGTYYPKLKEKVTELVGQIGKAGVDQVRLTRLLAVFGQEYINLASMRGDYKDLYDFVKAIQGISDEGIKKALVTRAMQVLFNDYAKSGYNDCDALIYLVILTNENKEIAEGISLEEGSSLYAEVTKHYGLYKFSTKREDVKQFSDVNLSKIDYKRLAFWTQFKTAGDMEADNIRDLVRALFLLGKYTDGGETLKEFWTKFSKSKQDGIGKTVYDWIVSKYKEIKTTTKPVKPEELSIEFFTELFSKFVKRPEESES